MPSINMIASRRAQKRKLETNVRKLVWVLMAEFVLAILLGGWLCTKLYTTRGSIAELNQQLSKLDPIIAEIKTYDTKTGDLLPKLGLLNEAKVSTMRWYNILDKLTESLPTPTYLTQITSSEKLVSTGSGKDKTSDIMTTVSVQGSTSTQSKVGETMLRLGEIPEFDGVSLNYSRLDTNGGIDTLSFQMNATVKDSGIFEEEGKNGTTKS
jgi:Tfp pilus assembly protein PilN